MNHKNIKISVFYALLGLVFFNLGVFQQLLAASSSSETSSSENRKLLSYGDTIRIKGYSDFIPYEFKNKYGKPEGFAVDVVKAIMDEMGVPYKLELTGYKKAVNSLVKKEADMLVGMKYSHKRAKEFAFGPVIGNIRPCAVYKDRETEISSISDLSGKIIVIQNDELFYKKVRDIVSDSSIIRVNNALEGLRMLVGGKADVFICAGEQARVLMYKHGYTDLKISVIEELKSEEYCIVGNDMHLMQSVGQALNKIKNNGVYVKIQEKWFNSEVGNENNTILYWILGFLGISILVIMVFNYTIQKKIKYFQDKWQIENRKYRTMFESALIGVEYYDSNGILAEMNTANCKIYGLKNKEIHIGNISLYDIPILSDRINRNDIKPFEGYIEYDFEALKNIAYFKDRNRTDKVIVDVRISPIFSKENILESIIVTSIDVTQAMQQRILIEEAYSNIKKITEISNVTMWYYDMESKEFYVLGGDNGTDAARLRSDEGREHMHPEDVERTENNFYNLISGREEKNTQVVRLKTDNESYDYWELSMSVVKDSEGKIYRIRGFQRNVQDLYKAETHLNKQFKILDVIYKNLPVGIELYDEEGRMVSINDFGCELKGGVKRENLLGTLLVENPNTPEYAKENYLNGVTYNYETDYDFELASQKYKDVTRKGKRIYQVTSTVIKNDSDKIYGYLQIITDVTDRRINDRELIELSANLDLAMEAGDLSAWVYDLKERKFLTLRGDALAGSGISIEENRSMLHPGDCKMQEDLLAAMGRGEKRRATAIFRYRTSEDNRYRYYESRMAVKDVDGKITQITGTQKDITEEVEYKFSLEENFSKIRYAMKAAGFTFMEFDVKTKNVMAYNEVILGNGEANSFKMEDFVKVAHPEDVIGFKSCVEDMYMGKDVVITMDVRFKFPDDGMWHYCPITILPFVKNKFGHVIRYVGIRGDNTNLMRLNKELKELNEETQTILDNLPVGVAIYNRDGYQIYINKSTGVLFGVTDLEAHINKHIKILEDPILSDEIKKDIALGKEIDARVEYDLNVPNQTGYYDSEKEEKLYLDGKVRYLRDSDGNVERTILIMEDVTEKCLYEKKLEENVRKTEIAIRATDMVFWDFDSRTRLFRSYNEPIVDYDNEKTLEYNDFLEYFHSEDVKQVTPHVKNMEKQKDESFSVNVRVKTKYDKDWRYCTVTGTPFEKDEKGNVVRYVGFRRDNTENIKLNRELQEFADKIKYILKYSNVSTWDYNLKKDLITMSAGSTESNVMTVAEYVEEIDPTQKEEVLGLFDKMAKRVVSDFSHHKSIKHNMFLNGHMVDKYFMVNGVSIKNEKGDIVSYSGLRREVTELIETQINLHKEKEKAQAADKLKSAFLANMSHEIRTPLNAIVGFSELLQATEDKKEKEEYIKIINTNKDLLLRLINDILDLSKIESGLLDLRVESFDFADVFLSTYKAFNARCVEKGIELKFRNPYKSCRVNLDRNRIGQICSNLLSNAVKYTQEGSILMGYEYLDGGLKFYVKDTGIGIAKEKQYKIFKRFEKLDSFAQGTGLGLSICKAIVSISGGKIWFESEAGRGSTFYVWVPCKCKVIKKDEEESEFLIPDIIGSKSTEKLEEEFGKKGRLILVAEDIESNYLLVKAVLRKDRLVHAKNGEEALELAKKNKYNVILMDIKMPIMNGIEATKKIREFDTDTPIIAVTANAYDIDRQNALDAGCNAFIAKPFSAKELEDALGLYERTL